MNYKPQFLIHQFSNSLIHSASGGNQSIKNNKLCKTNPILSAFGGLKSLCSITNYNEKLTMDTWPKRTQTKPIKPNFVRLRRDYAAASKAKQPAGQAGGLSNCVLLVFKLLNTL